MSWGIGERAAGAFVSTRTPPSWPWVEGLGRARRVWRTRFQKHWQQTPSFFWHAATKLLPFPTTFLDHFRPRTTAIPEKEPVHGRTQLGKTGQQKQAKAFSSPNLGALLKFCRYTLLTLLLAAVLFKAMESISGDKKGSCARDLQAGGVGLDTKVAEPAFNVQGKRANFERGARRASEASGARGVSEATGEA